MPEPHNDGSAECCCWDCAHRWHARNEWLASRCPKCGSKNVLEQARDD